MNGNDYYILLSILNRMKTDVVIKAFSESLRGNFAQSNPAFKSQLIEDLRTHLNRHYPTFFSIIKKYI